MLLGEVETFLVFVSVQSNSPDIADVAINEGLSLKFRDAKGAKATFRGEPKRLHHQFEQFGVGHSLQAIEQNLALTIGQFAIDPRKRLRLLSLSSIVGGCSPFL